MGGRDVAKVTADGSSYRQILHSSSIVAGASVISVVISLVRTKLAALLLGPAGVGVIGLYANLAGTLSSVAGLGIGTTGTRQVAEATAAGRDEELGAARRSLFWGTLALAAAGAVLTWFLRAPAARWMLDDPARTTEVGWLALAVMFLVAGGGQRALLNGLRRTGDLAWVRIAGAALSTVVGGAVLFVWMERGLVAFVVVEPLAALLVAWVLVARLRLPRAHNVGLPALARQWSSMVRLGVAFMLASLAAPIAQLVVRTEVQRALGEDALGHFQAAWTISMTYIGFVLTAMGTDFYPRLTGIIGDRDSANRLVNQQIEVALTIAGPLFLALIGLAPWVIDLLYASSFADAVSVLRWHVLGDVLKVASWPLGYILLAAGEGRLYLATEVSSGTVFALATSFALPVLGLEATGVAFLAMYVFFALVVYGLARWRTGFRLEPNNRRLLFALLPAVFSLHIVANFAPWVAAVLGVLMSIAFGIHAFVHLTRTADLSGPPAALAARLRTLLRSRQTSTETRHETNGDLDTLNRDEQTPPKGARKAG